MASDSHGSTSPPQVNVMASAEDKPRLTEEEKRANHIASEQKRRQAIRDGFDQMAELVPGMSGQGRSEGQVLNKATDYIHQLLEERKLLIEQLVASGVTVSDQDKKLIECLEESRKIQEEKPNRDFGGRYDAAQEDQDDEGEQDEKTNQ
ncbi:hypothetical protein OQA88_1056 [Cercophora sp. LCS_1]